MLARKANRSGKLKPPSPAFRWVPWELVLESVTLEVDKVMTAPCQVDALRGIEFLRGLSEGQLFEIAALSQVEVFPSGHAIFREGAEATDAYLVSQGSVSLEVCGPGTGCRRIMTICAGELLGWSPLLEQGRLTATARALAPTTAIRLPAAPVLALCQRDSQLGFELMRRIALAMSKRLSAARLQLLDIFGAETAQQ